MSQTFMLEPDIIAATENVMPELNTDLILAKNFLKQQSAATGDSLYDHLVDLIQKLLTTRPPDVVDNFEQYSWMVKQEKFRPNFDLLNDLYMSPPQLHLVRRVEEMFKVVEVKATKTDNFDEEPELDLEEDTSKPKIVDLIEHNYYFREGGYGLPDSECYAIYIALQMLAAKEPVATIRFFGKIFGTRANYYIAETDITTEELERRINYVPKHGRNMFRKLVRKGTADVKGQFKAFDEKDMEGEGMGEGEEKDEKEHIIDEEKEVEDEGEAADEKKPTGPVPPPLPPLPKADWQPPIPIPKERPGQGVNRKVYWVCSDPGADWVCLPDVTPDQIRVARLAVRVMTGDLDTEVLTFPPFDGTERNFLRAQIARIAASTSVSPQGFYTFGTGEEEEDFGMEEGGDMEFNQNPFYQGHTIKDLLDESLNYWVHHGRHILQQGRTIWFNPSLGLDEALENEEEEELLKITPEKGPTLMTSLSEDAQVEGMASWTPRCSSSLAPDRALATLRSNVWPGAVAYATNGKKSECLYIGWGLKFQPPNFSPLQLPQVQDEYTLGPEVMEMTDPTFADEEAYRIAHLPPPPPPELPGEGEMFGMEEMDDEEEEE